jgi:hypothetical protein
MTGDLTVPNLESAGDIESTSQNGGPLAGFRNQLQNGLFQIRQRGDSFTAPADEYTFDRWWMGNAAGRTVAFVKEGPFMSAILITNNTSDNVFLRQGIEIQQGESGPFVQGTTWTLSLWSDSSSWVGRSLGVCAFRNAGKMNDSSGQRGQTANSFVATGETNGVYKRYALQITIDTLPAATHEMFCIGLSLPSGGHRITGVQLEPGPVATPMEIRPIQTELALCQRYFNNVYKEGYFYRASSTGSYGLMRVDIPEMRTTPTITTRAGTPAGVGYEYISSSGYSMSFSIGDATTERGFDISADIDAEL